MGADAYSYVAVFNDDPLISLKEAQEAIFAAGEFNGSDIGFKSIEEALMEMAECGGTGSLLDVHGISDQKEMGCATRFSDDSLIDFFGTAKPTSDQVEKTDVYYRNLERGECRFFLIYDSKGEPESYFFFGLSWD